MNYSQYILKRKIENVLIFPFIGVGKLISKIFPLKQSFDIFFFFPFYHTGGAEKVHLQICQTVKNKKAVIYFTKKSADKRFLKEFTDTSFLIKNISAFTDNKWLYFLNLIYRGIIAGYINSTEKPPIVFNGQCNFGYKISPWIHSSIQQIELIHSYNSFSWIRIPFLPFISKTIMISQLRIEDHKKQYDKIGIPESFKKNIEWIINGVEIPESKEKQVDKNIKILYVGRGTEEKRVHIIAQIAKEVKHLNLPFNFYFMGDIKQSISNDLPIYCNFLGNITDPNIIQNYYQESHVLLLTSTTEGFPLVIAEAMMNKCVIASTAVGDIPYHLNNSKNLLFSDLKNEFVIIKETIDFLTYLTKHPEEIISIGNSNRLYAIEHFNISNFNKKYQQLLNA